MASLAEPASRQTVSSRYEAIQLYHARLLCLP